MHLTTLLPLLLTATTVSAVGCATHTFGSCPPDNIVHWYDPDDGQICDPLDCGGGRAPPKYNVPCCAAYTGTLPCVTTPSYLPCFAKSTPPPSPTSAPQTPSVAATTTTPAPPPVSEKVEPTSTPIESSAYIPGPTNDGQTNNGQTNDGQTVSQSVSPSPSESVSQSGSDVASVTQAPSSAGSQATRILSRLTASTVTLPVATGGAAAAVNVNALVAVAGAFALLA